MKNYLFRPVKIGGATAIVTITSFISYVIGLLRDRIIAINFGTTSQTDIYNASFLIPDILFNLFIAGALMAAFLPIFTEYLIKDKKESFKIANTMINAGSLIILLLSIIAFFTIPKIIPTVFSNAPADMQKEIINMTRLMLPSAIIFAISNTIGNILMSYKHFIGYSLSPIFYNLGIIFGVIFLNERFGIYSATIGVLIGGIFHLMIRIIDLRKTEFKYKFELFFSHPGFKKILKLMVPRSIALISWQLNLYIFAVVGITLREGGLAAFNFARNIETFAVSLFGISFATAVFPNMAEAVSLNEKDKFTSHIQKNIQKILFFTIPSMAGMMVLSKEIVELVLGGGVFEEKSIQLTSLILFFFAFSIPFESLSHIFARAFYALKDTFTSTIINISAMALIAICTIFIAPTYGIEWFSIGFTFGFIFYVVLMIIFLRKHLEKFNMQELLISLAKTIIASGIMAVAILLTKPLEAVMIIKLSHILRITIGIISFFLSAYLLKSQEISSIKYLLSRLTKKA